MRLLIFFFKAGGAGRLKDSMAGTLFAGNNCEDFTNPGVLQQALYYGVSCNAFFGIHRTATREIIHRAATKINGIR